MFSPHFLHFFGGKTDQVQVKSIKDDCLAILKFNQVSRFGVGLI